MVAVFSLGIISKEHSSAVQASPWLCLLFCLRAPIRHPACVRAEHPPFPAGNLNKRLPTPQTDHATIRPVLYGRFILFPISAAKGLHSIHRQVKDSADSLVSLSHGSQSPNFLLLFLCHYHAPSPGLQTILEKLPDTQPTRFPKGTAYQPFSAVAMCSKIVPGATEDSLAYCVPLPARILTLPPSETITTR